MPAPKSKSSANANGSAKEKTASRSGTATPVSTIDKKEDTLDRTATLPVGKPDKKAYDAEQAQIKSEIDALHVKLASVREKIGLASNSGAANDRRNELRSQLNEIKSQQASSSSSRTKLKEQLQSKQEALSKKIKDLQAAKVKIPFKTVAEIDAHIKNLEKGVESGNLKLAEEKRALADISTAKRNRRVVEGFQAEQEAIDSEKREIEELRKQYDDPEAKALSDKFESIRAELDELKKEGDAAAANRSKLFEERDKIQAEIKIAMDKKRDSYQQFKDANDRYWAKVNEDRARRAERARAQKAAEEKEKKKQIAERLLEEAQSPAFQAQIEDCQTLIDYFSGKTSGSVSYKSTEPSQESGKNALPGVPKLEPRKVEEIPEGSVVRKKKGEDEEVYFVAGKGKNKGKKSTTPSTPSTPSGSLNVPLPTLSALLTLSIPAPSSATDVPRVIEDLKTKKAWFEANQARVTAENIAKAQAEIQRLTGDAAESKTSTEPPSPQEPKTEELPASTDAETKSDS